MIISAFETMVYDGVSMANIVKCPTTYLNRIKAKYQLTSIEIPYDMRADEVAYKLYGASNLQWVFGVLNPQIKDGGFNDWLLGQNALYEYTLNKYKNFATPDDIHHHEDEFGTKWYNVTNENRGPRYWYNKYDDSEELLYEGIMIPKSNLDYERDLNDAKFKKIKIIHPRDIGEFVSDILSEIRKSGV